MKTATVRALRNDYSSLLALIEAGEEIAISRRGRVIAHLVPAKPPRKRRVDWSKSAALQMDKSKFPMLDAKTVAELLHDNQGSY